MLERLYQLPNLLILAIAVGGLVGVAMLAPYLGAKVFRLKPNRARDEAAFDAFKAVMAMAGFVLAFSLVQVNSNLRTVELAVAHEGNLLSTVDRTLLRFGSPEAANARPLLASFGSSLVSDEWPAMTHGERSMITEERYTALSRTARAIEPTSQRQQTMFAELLKALDDLSDGREALISDSEMRLPDFFWTMTGGFLALGLLLAVVSDANLTRAAALGANAAGIALLLAFVVIVDQPFKGQTSVTPADIQKAIQINSRRI